MEKSRSILLVISQLLEVIPPTETELIQDIKNHKEKLWNQAPEILASRGDLTNALPTHYWSDLGKILGKHVRAFDHKWQEQLLAIFNNTM
jgi:hypothetical protein